MQKLEVNRAVAFGDISTEVSCSTKKKKKWFMLPGRWKKGRNLKSGTISQHSLPASEFIVSPATRTTDCLKLHCLLI